MKKKCIYTALILGLLTVSCFAQENNLVQLDLKKSSGDSVDVTLVTSDNYGDNVMVRKKSDNKYVILIPKVQSSGYSASNLLGVRDLVSNVDVKTVNDTSGGYTKVTLITTKPLDIKTRTVKSKPLTAEQKEYNTLIAQANTVKNTVASPQLPQIREQKTEVTVNKAPKQETKVEQKKKETKTPDIKLTEITPEAIEKQNRQQRKNHLAELVSESRRDKALEELPAVPQTQASEIKDEVKDIEEMPKPAETSKFALAGFVKNGISKFVHKLPKAVGVVLLLLLAVSALRRFASKLNIHDNVDVADNFEHTDISKNDKYDNIVNNKELSWKEKYKMYLDKSATPVERADGKGKYSFIKTPAYMAKRQSLEKMVTYDAPERFESEESSIARTIKLRAFENNVNSMSMTNRNISKSRFKKYEVEIPLKEQKTINLEDSPLSSNPRSFKGANLKVSDVDKTKPYIMSSVDEYLSILDSEKQIPSVSNPIAKGVSNPIAKSKESSYFKGSVVKSGVKISPDKGIYLVNKNGKNTLVGKVNDKVFLLKDFNENITNPIQVRHDSANVYMVKAGGFKSLVEINDDKMGVLIEL